MDEWTNPATYNSKPGPYWVMGEDGWAYWAEAITPDTATGLLLDNITLKANIEDDWYYAVEPVASFATFNEVDLLKAGSDQDGQDLLTEITKPTVTSLTIWPSDTEVTLSPGDTKQFSTVVNGENFPGQDVTYTLSAPTGSTTGTPVAQDPNTMIDAASGKLTIGRDELNTGFTVTITPVADPTKATTVKVNVTIPFESFVYDLSYSPSDPIFGASNLEVILLIGDNSDNNYVVDWGDGTTPALNTATHTYTTQDTYTITVSGRTPGGVKFSDGYYTGYGEKRLTEATTPLLQQSSTDARALFCNCSNLTSISPDLFSRNPQIINFYLVFYGCANLVEIPSGLFDNNTEVTNFASVFDRCSSLAVIPSGLFDKNTKVTSFAYAFVLTSLGAIPDGLFENNKEVVSFAYTFQGCTKLEAIPSSLFDNNTKVTSFNAVFTSCTGLTEIPSGLFDNNTKVGNLQSAFAYCNKITSIPEWWNYPSTFPQFHLDLTANANALRMFTGCGNVSNNYLSTVPTDWK
jgi:hypothetical protein